MPAEARLGRRRAAAVCDRARRVPAEPGGTPPSADGAAIDPLELERPPRAPVAVGRRRQLHRPTKGQHRRDDEEAAAWLQLPGGGAEHALRVVDAIEHVEQRDDVKRPRAGGLLELGDAAIAPPPAQLAPQWSARLERDHVVSPSDFQRGGECARRLSAAGTDVEQPLGLRRRSAIE